LTFPPADGNQHPAAFSSFINLLPGQSLPDKVPYKFDAGIRGVGNMEPTAALRQRLLNLLQRLILILPFDALHTDSFSIFNRPVETSTTPCIGSYDKPIIKYKAQNVKWKFLVIPTCSPPIESKFFDPYSFAAFIIRKDFYFIAVFQDFRYFCIYFLNFTSLFPHIISITSRLLKILEAK